MVDGGIDIFDLTGKVAVVTGGNGGIGYGMARGLARAGANIAVVARNEKKSAQAAESLRDLGVEARAFQADVSDADAVSDMVDTELTRNARREVDGLHDRVLARTPAGRWGDIEDFEGLAIFFASPASNFITGVAMPVDGGFSVSG